MKSISHKRALCFLLCGMMVLGVTGTAVPRASAANSYSAEFVVAEWDFGTGEAIILPIAATSTDVSFANPDFVSYFSHSGKTELTYDDDNYALRADGWATGEYWQIETSTQWVRGSCENLVLSFEAFSSLDGPKNFTVEYSTDGGDGFSQVDDIELETESSTFSMDLPEAAEGADELLIRLRMTDGESVEGGGVSRDGLSYINCVSVKWTYIGPRLAPPSATPAPGTDLDRSGFPSEIILKAPFHPDFPNYSEDDSDALIMYTINDPDIEGNGIPYTGPITGLPSGDFTIRAVSILEITMTMENETSDLAVMEYKFNSIGTDPDPDPDTGNPGTVVVEDEIPLTDLPVSFDDISGHWAESFIAAIAAKGYVSGVGGGNFAPDRMMTRAEFCQTLFNAFGSEDDDLGAKAFTDILASDWYFKAVMWAAGMELAGGFTDGSFRPDQPITRQDMAVMTVKLCSACKIQLPEVASEAFADDSSIAGYARTAVYALKAGGVISGKPGNRFDPVGLVTRAECAVILCRLLEYAQPTPPDDNTPA